MKVGPKCVSRSGHLRFLPDLIRRPVPENPPLVVVEILSERRPLWGHHAEAGEYRKWGVANIWVIDPSLKRFSIYTERGLQNVSSLGLADYSFQITPAELFADL